MRAAGSKSDAALAEHDVVVPGVRDVLGREKPLLERRAHPPLQEHRAALPADRTEERRVLHVARAYLQHVRVLTHERDGLRVEHLGHDRHAESVGDRTQEREALFPEALEAVRARPRLEGASPQDLRAPVTSGAGARLELLDALDRAWPRDEDHLVAANLRPTHGDLARAALSPRHARIGLPRLEHERHAGHVVERARVPSPRLDRVADSAAEEPARLAPGAADRRLDQMNGSQIQPFLQDQNHVRASHRTHSSASVSTKKPTLTQAFTSKNALSILARPLRRRACARRRGAPPRAPTASP